MKKQQLPHNWVMQVLLLQTAITLWYAHKCFICPSHFVTQNNKEVLKGWDLIKLIIFTASWKTFLSETSFFKKNYECVAVNTMITIATALIKAKMPAVSPTIALVSSAQMLTQ